MLMRNKLDEVYEDMIEHYERTGKVANHPTSRKTEREHYQKECDCGDENAK